MRVKRDAFLYPKNRDLVAHSFREIGVTNTEVLSIKGLRVLVVEDSFLIAWSLRRMLSDLGCKVIGPASTVRSAIELIEQQDCDAAILDVNLAGETSMPVAAVLTDRGRPFLFLTGYSSPALVEAKFNTHRRLRKPLTESTLRSAVIEEFTPTLGSEPQ